MHGMKFTPEKATAFCAALAETCNVGQACRAVGISRQTAYNWREADADFALAWDRAMKAGLLFGGEDETAVSLGFIPAVLAGAVDYLTWPCDAAQVIGALIGAESTGAALGSLKLREARARSRVQRLTRREREVLAGVAVGLSNRLIGEQLEISPRTVEIHRANMLTKMGAQHTSEAIRIAIEASLVA